MTYNIEERIKRHIAFWEKEEVNRPLIGFQFGEYTFAERFPAIKSLMKRGKKITPKDISISDLMQDYENIFYRTEKTGQDAFYTPSPLIIVPWMEAILGCNILAMSESMAAKPYLEEFNLEIMESAFQNRGREWFNFFLEFTKKLVELAEGRFPVGQPILRGPSDMMGAVRGQQQIVYDLLDKPEKVKIMGERVTEIYIDVIKKQKEIIPEFEEGYSMGFYHLWSPGKCLWLQEDLSAILSPELYREYILPLDKKICELYEYTAFHLHPSSFFILDDLLEIDSLKVIQINKDIEGPSIEKMLPIFKKTLKSKRLIIWGDLSVEEIDLILDKLPSKGLYLNIVAKSLEDAKNLTDHIKVNS